MNPKDSVWPKTRNEVISTPVIYEGIVYIANGQDPEHGEGVGHLYAIDPTKTRRHHEERPDLALRQDPPLDLDRRHLQRHPVLSGLQRLPARARRQDRQAVLDATTCSRRSGDRRSSSTARSISATRTATSRSSTPTRARGAGEADVVAESNMGSSVYSTPVPANGALFIVNRNELFAISGSGAAGSK